ncbi:MULTISPECIES: hypothetical protein [Chromobacterium]|uniref:Salmonella invasion protein A N-terminal domain-containing protein n=1 Tax=Chromobacterium rhizoryzae TaxID=1778675 RepID=A0AAD0RUJ0_9NEIS|nr:MULTISPECIES: hypothetical protein [Chromobacterium]AXT48374.1 hypothetical protein D1345_20385 [Chromobacterium rhizoryzae]
MTITGASSPRLTRSLSVPADALRRPATPLSESYSGGRSSAATPARRHSVSDPASFKAQHTRDSVASLFSASPQAKALYQLYRASPNVHAKGEIEEFAKVYAKLKQQPDLSPQDAKSLDDLARQYTARILKDGLGVESAFGPWLDSCKQQYKLRSELEHKLAVLANEHCGGDTMKLGNAFMLREVSTFILSYVETQLGRPLDVATGKQVLELVDSAARQAFDALRQSRDEMLRQSGPSLGRQARDLDTVAILPQLLRSVLAGLGQEAPPQAKPDLPDEPKGPDAPKPDPSAAPAGGPNITINVGGITIDNSVNITDSGNTSDSGNSSRSQRPARGRRDPSRLVQRLNLKMHQQQGAQRGSESGDGQTRRAAASGDGAGRSFRSMETQTEATGGRDGTSRTTEVQTPVTDLDTSRITVSSTDAERVVIPADASTQADDTTAASPLSFKLWRSSFPEVVLKSVIYQSDANKAAGALAQDIRTAMLLDSRGELDRGPLVQARDAFLPKPGSSEDEKLYGAAMSETAWQHLRQGLEQHPQQAQLRGQILKTARLTSIGKFEGDKDCVIRRLLNWASVQAPTAGQATTGAGRRVEGVLRRDPFNVQNLSSQPVAHAATAQRSQPLTTPTRTDTPPVLADGGAEAAHTEPKAMDLRRQAFLQGMLNGNDAQPSELENPAASSPSGTPPPLQSAATAQAATPADTRPAGGFNLLRFGNMPTLPTLSSLRQQGMALNGEVELLRAARSVLAPEWNPSAQQREFDALRKQALPDARSGQTGLLSAFANGTQTDAQAKAAERLQQVLATHQGLAGRREALNRFAGNLIKEGYLLANGQKENPLVLGLLDAVGLDAATQRQLRDDGNAQRKTQRSADSEITLTTDGLHLDPSRIRERNRVR